MSENGGRFACFVRSKQSGEVYLSKREPLEGAWTTRPPEGRRVFLQEGGTILTVWPYAAQCIWMDDRGGGAAWWDARKAGVMERGNKARRNGRGRGLRIR